MAGVLDALASYVQHMLMQMAAEEVHMLLGVSGEIDNMAIKLRDLKNFLADADRKNITDQSVQAWVIELKNAMYQATDILDLCQLKAMEQGPKRDAGCFNPLLFCIRNPLHTHDIGSRIKSLNNKLDSIKARGASFNFINLAAYEDHGRKKVPSSLGTRETSWGIDESSLVGERIEEDTTNLVQMLINERKIWVSGCLEDGPSSSSLWRRLSASSSFSSCWSFAHSVSPIDWALSDVKSRSTSV